MPITTDLKIETILYKDQVGEEALTSWLLPTGTVALAAMVSAKLITNNDSSSSDFSLSPLPSVLMTALLL